MKLGAPFLLRWGASTFVFSALQNVIRLSFKFQARFVVIYFLFATIKPNRVLSHAYIFLRP